MVRAQAAMAALRTLAAHRRGAPLTVDDRTTLLAWAGWGSLAPAFEGVPKGGWATIADELDVLLDDAAMRAAVQQVDTSFFTPNFLIDAVFDVLRSVGFTGGRVLEPGCGTGRFMVRAPERMAIDWTGVEIDPTSAAIASALNPEATIAAVPLQERSLISGSFDAVVGNVPFSSSHVYDKAFGTSSIHEYFIARSLDAVRAGGYVVLLTSRFIMDSETVIPRLIRGEAELMGAVRLPSGAFTAEGTEVVVDMIILRKLMVGEQPSHWADNGRIVDGVHTPALRLIVSEPATEVSRCRPEAVSGYWGVHPEHVAGTMKVTSFFQNPIIVSSDNRLADINAAVEQVKTVLRPQGDPVDFSAALADVPLADADGRKEGSFHVIDDAVNEVIGGVLTLMRNSVELRALIIFRDAAVKLVALESDSELSDAAIYRARVDALALYTAYVAKFGALNRGTLSEGKPDPDTGLPTFTWRRPALGGFRRDPDYSTVIAMEQFDQNDGTAAPAPILLRRVNHRPVPVRRVDTAGEALAVSLGETQTVELARISSLLGLGSDAEALAVLGNLVFNDGDGNLIAARDYLSGDVRSKLQNARNAAATNPALESNVAALEGALPADLGPLEIRVTLGAPWVAASDIENFSADVLGCKATVEHTPAVSSWEVSWFRYGNSNYDARVDFGTSRAEPMQLLDWALNGKAAILYDEVWSTATYSMKRVRNHAESLAASEKMKAIDDRFSTWIWEDGDRAERVAADYNRLFNSHVARTADGSGLVFPGLAEEIIPWTHQRDAVDRIVSSERALIGHPVGAGKTKSMILAAMTLRRFGLAQKPMIAVPNHLLDQIVREAQQAYPTAKFLIASKEDLTRDRRRVFAARCATGDWDAVVITHQAFTSMPVAPEAEARWIEAQKWELREAMHGIAAYDNGRGPKAIARAMRSLEARLTDLRSGVKDEDQIMFEQLGVDYLMVDESHLFRRLATGSTSRDSGFGSSSSKRATDLLLKIETLAEKHPGKPIVSMFTGTPWANTLAETWVWQRYLQPEALVAAGVKQFDPWVATFVRYENAVEVAPDGSGFRIQRRPAGMKNLPELRTMLSRVASIVRPEDIGLERPDHTVHNIVVEAAPQQHEFVRGLAARADAIRGAGKAERPDGRGDDSMLLVCNDGRAAALDPMLVGLDERSPKVAEVARKLAQVYADNADNAYGSSTVRGAFHLVLLDLGTPHPGDSAVYGRLRQLLVMHGVPANKIRWIHEAKTDKARAALFAQCREGSVAILMGSTSKVGMGTNIQTRLKSLWHIDAPWTPAEVEQREGRALRPNNLNTHVDVFRCVTEGTFDAYTWQALERKARSFSALYDINGTAREVEDISGTALSYGEVKALAAGNPMLLEQAKTAATVQRLRLMRSVYLQNVNRAKQDCAREIQNAADSTASAERLERYVSEAPGGRVAPVDTVVRLAGTIAKREEVGYFRATHRNVVIRRAELTSPKRGWITLLLEHGYSAVGEVVLKPKTISRGAEEILDQIVAAVDNFADNAGDNAASQRLRAATALKNAGLADSAAESAVFDREEELQNAIATLVRIEMEITAEAVEFHGAAA